jgi:hypothetical protein
MGELLTVRDGIAGEIRKGLKASIELERRRRCARTPLIDSWSASGLSRGADAADRPRTAAGGHPVRCTSRDAVSREVAPFEHSSALRFAHLDRCALSPVLSTTSLDTRQRCAYNLVESR